MNAVRDIAICLEKRETLPRSVCGLVMLALIGVVGLFGYYVWNGAQEDVVSAEVLK
jgi:predicted negative regulator of RcsB-dependent stress response